MIVAASTLGLNFFPTECRCRSPLPNQPPNPQPHCLLPSPHLCLSTLACCLVFATRCCKMRTRPRSLAAFLHIPPDSPATCINNSGCCETVPGKDSSRACCQNEVSEHCSVFSPPLVPPCPPARPTDAYFVPLSSSAGETRPPLKFSVLVTSCMLTVKRWKSFFQVPFLDRLGTCF